jgi:hypothetical protein
LLSTVFISSDFSRKQLIADVTYAQTASLMMHLFRSTTIIFTLYRFFSRRFCCSITFILKTTFAASGFCPQGDVTDLWFAL